MIRAAQATMLFAQRKMREYRPTDLAGLLRGSRRQSYAFTFVVGFAEMAAAVFTLRLTAQMFGTVGFGEYAVARRAMSVLAFPLLLGLGISIPRFVAMSSAAAAGTRREQSYFLAALIVSAPILLAFCLLVAAFPTNFATLFFGDSTYVYMTVPIALAMIGLHLQTMVYGYFRGLLRMWRANAFDLLNTGVVPLLAVVLSGRSAARAIALTGGLWIAISFVVAGWLVVRMGRKDLTRAGLGACARDLFAFGVPRVPGEFALFALFAVPTFIVSNRSGVQSAGYFSFGVSLVQLVGGAFASAGVLLLPYVSGLAGGRRWSQIDAFVSKVLWVSVGLAMLAVAALESILSFAVPLFMGESFSPAVNQSRWLLLGAVPYVAYFILRNPLDAIVKWPHNSINLVVSLLVLVGLLTVGGSYVSAQIAIFATLCVLGLLSLRAWRNGLRSVAATPAPARGIGHGVLSQKDCGLEVIERSV